MQRKRGYRSARLYGEPPRSWRLAPTISLLLAALTLGGSANPLGDMAIELIALAALILAFARFRPADWAAVIPGLAIIAVTVVLAIIELTPLPYHVWILLPGRRGPALLLDTLSLGGKSHSLSLDPNATISTFLQVIPGIAAFICTLAGKPRDRKVIELTIVAGACFCLVLGFLQIIGQSQFYFYRETHHGDLAGIFANRDHAVDMLLIAIALLFGGLGSIAKPLDASRIFIVALIILNVIAALLTVSRFGILLLIIELCIITVYSATLEKRVNCGLIVTSAVGAIIAGYLLMFSDPVSLAIDRFSQIPDDLRPEIWSNTIRAIHQYWPVGSGLGSFVPVYQSFEGLDKMPVAIINHAHDEYLELMLELGVFGAVTIAAYAATMLSFVLRHRRLLSPSSWASVLGIAVLLSHSIVDFPLRNEALMVTFGVLHGIVFAEVRDKLVANNRMLPQGESALGVDHSR